MDLSRIRAIRVEELLEGRPHTVFAGHYHTYTKHVLEVWDDDVRRTLAMKVILSGGKADETADAPRG